MTDLRVKMLDMAREFAEKQQTKPFVAGETYIPVSGKVLDADDLANLIDASLDMHLTTGRFSDEFEERLSAQTGIKHASLTVSGSAANLLAFSTLTSQKLRERKILPGSEVISVAAGFPTTISPIVQNGCKPVFVDINPDTYNINTNDLERAISSKTRAIMLAHTMGNPFDLDVVRDIANRHKLFLIEDCCDALGATYRGDHVGTFGDLATLSFYPAHHITMGEGGAVLTNKGLLKLIVNSLRDWGRDCWCDPGVDNTCGKRWGWKFEGLPDGYDHKYVYSHIGYNLKVTDMQAAIGCGQLNKVEMFIEKRKQNFAILNKGLKLAGLEEYFVLPKKTPNSDPSWFGYLLTLRDSAPFNRTDAVRYLEENKIATRQLFSGNILRQPGYRDIDHRVIGELPVTNKVMRDTFWIGVWPGIGEGELDYMIYTMSKMVKDLVR